MISAHTHTDSDMLLLVINRPDGLPEVPYDDELCRMMSESNDWDSDYDGGQTVSNDEFQGLTIVNENELVQGGDFHHEY